MIKKKPATPQERKALQDTLYGYAEKATREGTTKGLARFISSYEDSEFVALLISWLEQYTPIRKQENRLNTLAFQVPNSVRTDYDLAGARLNPCYSMEPPPIRPVAVIIPPASASSHPLSEREMAKKGIKRALNKFLTESTVESRSHLIELVKDFPLQNQTGRKFPFLQGGAPGLGKR